MGYFTWKDCQDRRKSVGYDKKVYLICPDDSVIVEDSYYGYGIFDRKDVYDLVVDWNRPYLKEIMDKIAEMNKDKGGYWGQDLYPVAVAAVESDEKAIEALHKIADKLPNYLICDDREWKRTLGITIACEDECHKLLPYPIKMSATMPKKPYAKLGISWSTQ